jgi:predicted nucleic acid-binding protein
MSGSTFVDTNVLIYAHDVDAGQKHEIARDVRAPVTLNNRTEEIATAIRIEDEAHLGFWDALVAAAASKSGATSVEP